MLIVDVAEGVREQTRRHSYLLSLLGLQQTIVVVNKMDLVGYEQQRYEAVRKDIEDLLKSIGTEPTRMIPISAIKGDNIAVIGLVDKYESGDAPK